jgi:D-serine dehydratase
LRGSTPVETLGLEQEVLDRLVQVAERCSSENLFSGDEVILSAGGSSFFDVVAERLKAAKLNRSSAVLLRAGCYITHDSVMYVRAFEALVARNPDLAALSGGLQAALEVCAYVQSRPEPGKAIIGFGKRDASYDDPPVALYWFRPGAMTARRPMPSGRQVVRLNDQHCHLTTPEIRPLPSAIWSPSASPIPASPSTSGGSSIWLTTTIGSCRRSEPIFDASQEAT